MHRDLLENTLPVSFLLSQYCDNFMSPFVHGDGGASMKVGCGFVEKTIHGQRYLYVWTFEAHGAGVRKVERYVGPARRPAARQKALREHVALATRAAAQLERRRAAWRRQLATP